MLIHKKATRFFLFDDALAMIMPIVFSKILKVVAFFASKDNKILIFFARQAEPHCDREDYGGSVSALIEHISLA